MLFERDVSGFGVDAERTNDVQRVGVREQAGTQLVIKFQFVSRGGLLR